MSAQTSFVPITIRGRYLWRGDSRFFVRGVVYQASERFNHILDPITDDRLPQLKQDVLLFKDLGLNTIFVYSIDNTKPHVQTMMLLEEAGIYVLTSVAIPMTSIRRKDPYKSYNSTTIKSFFKTVDLMASFPNTLGLLAASLTVNNDAFLSAPPVLKTVVRDLKRYMKLKNEIAGQRTLPIAYNATSTKARDVTILDYLSCGDKSTSIDFWTCQNFLWSGQSSMAISGYDQMIKRLEHATIPIFFTEYGANVHQPRLFQETKAIYSPQMSHVISGGCVYEFWQGTNMYGLVEMIEHGRDPKWSSYQASLARADDPSKTIEKRETEHGLFLIFHDFENYKASLAATRDAESDWDRGLVEPEIVQEASVDTTQISWPWEPEFREPESCIDWEQTEKSLRE
ncbi:glycoside hydrolase family 72 protein [Dothidotthia symphoricarpi CBS 119687]|uniref:1,3-beta-glucanosyltransferase n=1 Tax=Dothidotthia symphoricarpi CBS 119687 TaxID=1392245 RepID=A0A6A6A1A8_9PLEO|nr:glycoside hydrolase family 72 protein [Dothidotthia symphoricarpi CBS 119687]KAF2124341.1 glycoside hydrolase family 72 protein [Dothidotthia symphoricarpi CBS 119687]